MKNNTTQRAKISTSDDYTQSCKAFQYFVSVLSNLCTLAESKAHFEKHLTPVKEALLRRYHLNWLSQLRSETLSLAQLLSCVERNAVLLTILFEHM